MSEDEEEAGLNNLTVVLVEPQTPGNVGFAARVLANFGVNSYRIVGNDPRHDDYAQVFSARASDILDSAQIFPDLKSALSDMHASWAATARVGRNHSVTRAAVPLPDLPDPMAVDGRVALVFGREDAGLTNEEVALCDLVFTIPVAKGYPSMNLSHAIAVTLYELFKKYAPKGPPEHTEAKPATREEREIVYQFFDEMVDELDIKEYRRPIAKQVFRNLLGRAYMTGREVATLTGIVRKLRDLVRRSG
ncbi:MAG: RNA methyltransferase [Candidatus Thorarchaeota archaeon]|nr:MAG: RNA methyltransferase [Candidatus Thorarchaeota archaeon]